MVRKVWILIQKAFSSPPAQEGLLAALDNQAVNLTK